MDTIAIIGLMKLHEENDPKSSVLQRQDIVGNCHDYARSIFTEILLRVQMRGWTAKEMFESCLAIATLPRDFQLPGILGDSSVMLAVADCIALGKWVHRMQPGDRDGIACFGLSPAEILTVASTALVNSLTGVTDNESLRAFNRRALTLVGDQATLLQVRNTLGLLLNGGAFLAPRQEGTSNWLQESEPNVFENCLWRANRLPPSAISHYRLPPHAARTTFLSSEANMLTIIIPPRMGVRQAHILLEITGSLKKTAEFRLVHNPRQPVQLSTEEHRSLSKILTNPIVPLL
ncbi:unnamed protein product [Oikopleura dioica]|uniref:Uncharacterized protein n=1 Tax=Oikopleura dioica TaxID=34765 RepID=E4YMA3_OIKDI|nr:unnamed protein product [Oikopleura dioica]